MQYERCTYCNVVCNNKIYVPWDYPLCKDKPKENASMKLGDIAEDFED